MELSTYKIKIEGTVQGVGFRPFIYGLATRFLLHGTVLNGAQGVEIVVNASSENLQNFIDTIRIELPPLAHIDRIETNKIPFHTYTGFHIITTENEGETTVRIPPDVSICHQCEVELFDHKNRRFGYPFITCTYCGVRYSIIEHLPYDRVHTSMKFFKMCDICKSEYMDPLDRRYHAQPIGCWDCGPQLNLMDNTGVSLGTRQDDMVEQTANLLKNGKIVAIKGVGGYHLMCDATNAEAVAKLRKRKCRPSKPFAVMVKDINIARELGEISQKEETLLSSKERPIVIVQMKRKLATDIAPNMSKIGLFLPYTPLHLLLLDTLDCPLVATSANVTDEPICTHLKDLEKLQGVYDYVLEHDRKIVNGCDDSVVMVVKEKQILLRRARGYAPVSLQLPFVLSNKILALGANQKNTIAIGFQNQVILSPHIGDLNSIGSVEYYEKNIETLKRMYDFKPEVIAYDMHPHYESTKVAFQIAAKDEKIKTNEVQHHYAHILGVMAEKQVMGKVLGVAFDGTGYGEDGTLWGGEFMVCDYEGFERIAHVNYFKLLGGSKAIKEPRRVALSLLFDLYGEKTLLLDNHTTKSFSNVELKTYYLSWEKGLNAPLSSSIGRLFDAVASLLGVCQVMSFEGESGMMLEELYDKSVVGHYTFGYEKGLIDILPLIKEMLVEDDVVVAISKFFHTLVEIIVMVSKAYDLPLVLSGGVFQNRILLALVLERFPEALISYTIPPNDGGISLGQVVASA